MVESSDGDNFIANDCLWVDGIGIVYREEWNTYQFVKLARMKSKKNNLYTKSQF